MDRFKESKVAQSFGRFKSRYRIFLDGMPFMVSLFVGAFFLSRITKKRYVKDFLNSPTKEDMLAAGIDIDADLASVELEGELQKLNETLDTQSWQNKRK